MIPVEGVCEDFDGFGDAASDAVERALALQSATLVDAARKQAVLKAVATYPGIVTSLVALKYSDSPYADTAYQAAAYTKWLADNGLQVTDPGAMQTLFSQARAAAKANADAEAAVVQSNIATQNAIVANAQAQIASQAVIQQQSQTVPVAPVVIQQMTVAAQDLSAKARAAAKEAANAKIRAAVAVKEAAATGGSEMLDKGAPSSPSPSPYAPQPPSDNTMLYVAGAAALGLVVLMMSKKKSGLGSYRRKAKRVRR